MNLHYEIYDGTMESLKKLVINLKLKDNDYYFDVLENTIFLRKKNILLHVGDVYEYRTSKKFEVW